MVVTLTTDGALVQDADDCRRLHVETALEGAALRAAVEGTATGSVDAEGAVWLDVAVLRSRARLAAAAADWPQRWAAMIAGAERAGWLSPDGRAVRAHVERTDRGR